MTTVYWAGGEDSDLYQIGGGTVSTTTTYFRSAYARCALMCNASGDTKWHNWTAFAQSTFWTSGRVYNQIPGTQNNYKCLSWYDVSNIERLYIAGTGTSGIYKLMKIDGAASATQLGSNFTMTHSTTVTDKLDVYLVYNTSGTATIYWNGIQVFTYSGDVTTDAITSLSYIAVGTSNSQTVGWSEIIVADTDTRSWNLQTLAPVANGNTHDFDVGSPAASNVNEITLDDATLDGATTNGLIDQYTIPAIASGTYTIMGIGVSARMQKGASGPSKMDIGVRTGGSDYWSSDQALTTAWAGYQNWWATNPGGGTWAALPTNIGLKAVT